MLLEGVGGRNWSCVIEAKIGNAELENDQVERYLALAKSNGIDAVLTISNQFVALPTHSPTRLSRSAHRGVTLYHWSWMYVLTQALLLLHSDEVEQPEQRYILAEMSRYFGHPSIGVSAFDRMNAEWKDLVSRVQAGARISRSDPAVESTVAAWHQESRDLCLLMARKLFRQVRIKLPKAHAADPLVRLRADCETLATDHKMQCTLEIPDAAAPMVIAADLLRRSVTVSMTLIAPSDKQRASSRIGWILRQLSKADPTHIHVKANWPGRSPATQVKLSSLQEDPSLLEIEGRLAAPHSFEIMLVRDLAGKFGGTKTFLEEVEEAVPRFYEQVGQYVRAYVAPPPRIAQKADGADAGAARVATATIIDPSDVRGAVVRGEDQNSDSTPDHAE